MPVQFFGIFPAGRLTEEAADPSSENAVPWLDEIDHKPFASSVGIGPYSEVAFFHKKSKTLLVTDAVVQVPKTPPAVVEEGALLEAGGPLPAAVAAFSAGPPGSPPPPPPPEDPARRAALGWKRMALQILFFVPGDLGRPERSFDALAGKLIVSPVLRKLVFGNARPEALAWVDEICRDWPRFSRILPCHFEAPIRAGPRELRAAFSFLEEEEEEEEGEGEGAKGMEASTSGKSSSKGEEKDNNGGGGLGALFGGLFSAVSRSSPIFKGGGGAVPFDPADMRALDGLSGSLKTTGVLNK